MKSIHDVLTRLPHARRIKGPPAGVWRRARVYVSILIASAMILAMPSLMADEGDGTYKLKYLSGSLYVKGRKNPYQYSYWWGSFEDDDFYEKHSYPFPPEGILAAALGHGIVVKDKRIRVNLAEAREEIVRVILRDPRLKRVIYFNIKSLPEFRPFTSSDSGILYAGTSSPMRIEVGLKDGGDVTVASALADYRAEIRGNRLLMKVTFRGKGGPLGEDFKSYNISGTAWITTKRK